MRQAGDILDRVMASSPNGTTARIVTSESADNLDEPTPTRAHWKAPPAMRRPTAAERARGDFQDFTGIKYGRLTVLGMLIVKGAPGTPKGGALWVVRCVCGDYEVRLTRAVKRGLGSPVGSDSHNCFHCDRLRKLRHFDRAQARGELRKAGAA